MSITSETRREAYEAVAPRKLKRYQEILTILREYGPLTAEEITERLFLAGVIPAFDQNAARPRLTELKSRGRVEVTGKRESRRSGRKTALWAIRQEEKEAASAGTESDFKGN